MHTHPTSVLKIAVRVLVAVLLAVGLVVGPQVAPAEASQASHVKALIKKIIHSAHPKKTYSKLSKKDKALVKKEIRKGTVKVRIIPGTSSAAVSVPQSGSTSTCWRKTLEATYYGGITHMALYWTVNTTSVCASGGTVTEVSIIEEYQDITGWGWHTAGMTDSTLNVDWEGRGVVRGSFEWGAAGWILANRTICPQVRLNADQVHYSTSSECSVNA